MATEFKLPELGENIETIQVVKVLVKPGEHVAADQPVLELETDKATVEVPSTVDGDVREVHVTEGDEIRVGDIILTVEGGEDQAPPAAPAEAASEPVAEKAEAEALEPGADAEMSPPEALARGVESSSNTRRVAAAPSVRRFAREIGVDVLRVTGSGPAGRVSLEDVKRFAREASKGGGGVSAVQAPRGVAAPALPPLPEFEKWGPVQRDKISVIRRKTAEHMALSWVTIPHVTIFDKADITELEVLRKRFADRAVEAGGKLTMAVMVVKVVAQALKVFPRFNASLDMVNHEVVFKKYCHVGIAVNTDRGLVVPVVRDADQKNMVQIAVDITGIAEKARTGKLQMEDMEGGTFTVTNLGRICGTYFTPIINYPEVAILGIGRAHEEFDAEGKATRTMLPLSLSFDHRIIDGADGARFLGWIIEAIQEPLLLSLQG